MNSLLLFLALSQLLWAESPLHAAIVPGKGCGTTVPFKFISELSGDDLPEELPCSAIGDPKSFQDFYKATTMSE